MSSRSVVVLEDVECSSDGNQSVCIWTPDQVTLLS